MLPALVSLDDFAVRLGGVGASDEERAQACLNDASALIRVEAGLTWVNTDGGLEEDIPDVIVALTVVVAGRAFRNPDGARAETIGNYSVTWGDSSTGVYLTAGERRTARRAGGVAGIGDVALESPYAPTLADDIEWIDVDPPGDPIPWRMREDV